MWLTYFAGFVFPVFLQAYESWRVGFLTPTQMQTHGVSKGLPFLAHGGMWSDATLFAAVMATIMSMYATQWKAWQWRAAVVIGLVGSAVMHWGIYVNGSFPEAHVRDGMVTSAGMIHFFYMAVGLAVTMMFYTSTMNLTRAIAGWVSVLLVVHIIIGTHVPLRIWAKIVHPVWYPEQPLLDIPTLGTIFRGCCDHFGGLFVGSSLREDRKTSSRPRIDWRFRSGGQSEEC